MSFSVRENLWNDLEDEKESHLIRPESLKIAVLPSAVHIGILQASTANSQLLIGISSSGNSINLLNPILNRILDSLLSRHEGLRLRLRSESLNSSPLRLLRPGGGGLSPLLERVVLPALRGDGDDQEAAKEQETHSGDGLRYGKD